MSIIKRANIRFEPDENTLIILKTPSGHKIVGLATSESYAGCGGAFIAHDELVEGMRVELWVGKLDGQSAVIKWIKKLDTHIWEIGFHYE